MGVFVKICGCCSRTDAEAVAELNPDALGFILWPGAKRCVRPADIGEWSRALPTPIKKVGVFVNATRDEILEAQEIAGLDIIQLHGEETPAFCESLGGEVWKAIHLNRPLTAPPDAYAVSAFLVDHHGGAQPGGTGIAVDWNAAARFVAEAPGRVVLAGGLNPVNVAWAIGMVKPWGVDVSSGVESEVGKKDLSKVKGFIEACRSAS